MSRYLICSYLLVTIFTSGIISGVFFILLHCIHLVWVLLCRFSIWWSGYFFSSEFEKLLDGGMTQDSIADAIGKYDDTVGGCGEFEVVGDHD